MQQALNRFVERQSDLFLLNLAFPACGVGLERRLGMNAGCSQGWRVGGESSSALCCADVSGQCLPRVEFAVLGSWAWSRCA